MVILKWLHSKLVGEQSGSDRAQKSEKAQKNEKPSSVDLVNAAFVDHAEDLEDLIANGLPYLQRKKLKKNVKRKVTQVIADEFSDPEIIEDVTERITDAAEIDPFYKNLFGKDAE